MHNLCSIINVDVRVLLDNDHLLKEGSARYVSEESLLVYIHVCLHAVIFLFSAFSEYNTEQFTPAKVGENQVRFL